MKIIVYRYGSICEPDIIEQFKLCGLEISTIDNEITNKKITNSERIELLSNLLQKDSFLFVFSINFFPAISDLCELYKVPYVGWVVDSPVPELFSKSIKNSVNRIFCFDRKQYFEVSPYNPGHVFHLPLGTNVSRWDKVISGITAGDRAKYSCDVSFVGSLYTELDCIKENSRLSDYTRGYIEGLYQCQKQVQGFNLLRSGITPELTLELKEAFPDMFMPEEIMVRNIDGYTASASILSIHSSSLERIEYLSELSKDQNVTLFTRSDTGRLLPDNRINCRSGVETLTEMPKVFNLSKINLNLTIHSIETGISLRLWDVMGCGGFLLTNYQEELADMLVAGEDYDYFSDLGELKEKCAFYLAHEDIRQKIAFSGYEKTKKYHTYTNRLQEMIKTIVNM